MDDLVLSGFATPLSPTDDADAEMDLDDIDAPSSALSLPPLTAREVHAKFDESYARACKVHRESTPLEIEDEEVMMREFGVVVGRVCDAVQTRDWSLVVGWEGILQCWGMLQYPVPRPLRAQLAQLFFTLLTTPGIEGRLVHSFATALHNLIENRKRLAAEDWRPDWRRLWALIRREYRREGRADPGGNLASIWLHACGGINRFVRVEDVPELLETFLPLLNLTIPDTYLLYLPPLLALLPHSQPQLYLPPLLTIWEALNSAIIDERMLSFLGNLTVRHIEPDERGEGGDWEALREGKDGVGMWTEDVWRRVMGKCLRALNVPLAGAHGSSTTSSHADSASSSKAQRLHRTGTPIQSLCKIIVYSLAPDGEVKDPLSGSKNGINGLAGGRRGYAGGSRALESLERLITSTESFFHPSNAGAWSVDLTTFLHRITYEFLKRTKEEERPHSRVPAARRLTPLIRLTLVRTLKTVALLAMFSKDPISVLNAQLALRNMALLEPGEVMPELVARAYEGLEVINETHRTTAVMSAIAAIAAPLTTDAMFRGGAKDVPPLLEACLPGIDLNDPGKTMCSTLVVVALCQQIYISDLSLVELEGVEVSEEETAVRMSTAGFADWVTSYVRRVFTLIENLPEEGGKNNRTGGKIEDSVLKSIQSSLDVVFAHLSPELFDLVLQLIFDYASTTVRSNAVRAVGNLVLSLAKADPGKTIRKFWPFCRDRVREELENGASSIRSTSSGAGVASDTTLHWNLSILRGVFHFSCPEMVKYKDEIIDLFILLADKTKSERGYTYSARIISKLMGALTTIYPMEYNLVNADEMQSEEFSKRHSAFWGKMYLAEDVKINWHVPSEEETAFVFDLLDRFVTPLMKQIEELLKPDVVRDGVWRNDFVRYTSAVRASWGGLGNLYKEQAKQGGVDLLEDDTELQQFTLSSPRPNAGFMLNDPNDPRYKKAVSLRTFWGELLHVAGVTLSKSGSEDHIDAVNQLIRAIDSYMMEYGVQRSVYDSDHKRYNANRELSRLWPRQKAFLRHIWVRRAYLHVLARKYQHFLYRRRSALDDQLIDVITEFSISQYTRVRKTAQSCLFNITTTYTRSTRYVLPKLFAALKPGTDPDRMKGALYLLWNKSIAAFVVQDYRFQGLFLMSVLESSWQEKPSIQQVIASIVTEIIAVLQEETSMTVLMTADLPELQDAVDGLRQTSPTSPVDPEQQRAIMSRLQTRLSRKEASYDDLVGKVLSIANNPATHWRYGQMAIRFLRALIRRDRAAMAPVAELFVRSVCSENPTTRRYAQLGLEKMLELVKMRTFNSTIPDLLMESGRNPLKIKAPLPDPEVFWRGEQNPKGPLYDKVYTGWLIKTPTVDAYLLPPEDKPAFDWDPASREALDLMQKSMDKAWFEKLATLYAQESSGSGKDARHENVRFIMRIFKVLQDELTEKLIPIMEPLLEDKDRFKQRAAAELLAGLLRGTKNWKLSAHRRVWSWVAPRLPTIFTRITPDTLNYWEYFLTIILSDRDPRRCPGIDFIRERGLTVDFNGESAFMVSNAVAAVGILAASFHAKYEPFATKFLDLYWKVLGTGYAEVRSQVAANIDVFLNIEWHPSYPSVPAFVEATRETGLESLQVVNAAQFKRVSQLAELLPKLKESRLSGPKVNQSEYDKVGLTALKWIWLRAHSCVAPSIYPYMQPLMPEALRMSELMDSSDLRSYAIGLLYILSAVTPSLQFVEPVMDALINAVRTSPSWRIRLQVLPIMQVFYFRQLPLISDECGIRVMDVLVECLRDEAIEVREMAAKTLSGVIRCSQRHSILALKDRFVNIVQETKLPPRSSDKHNDALRTLHSGILGLTALIDAYPYSVPSWLPALLPILADHSSYRPPISTTVRQCAADFRRTHQDTWHNDQNSFDEDQLAALATIVSGTSYYA